MKRLLDILLKAIRTFLGEEVRDTPKVENPAPPKPEFKLNIPVKGSRAWKGIVVHHSASPDGPARDWDGIVAYHRAFRIDFSIVTKEEFERRLATHNGKVFQKPWLDVGYHCGTEFVNGEPVFHWGRPLPMVGAHAGVAGVSNKFNDEFLGLCVVGNYDAVSPDPKLWEFNVLVIRALMKAFKISAENVIGHCEVFDRLNVPRQKSCPGRCFSMALLRGQVA